MNIDAPWNYSTYLHTSVNASILHAPNSVHPEVHPLIRNLQTASTSFPWNVQPSFLLQALVGCVLKLLRFQCFHHIFSSYLFMPFSQNGMLTMMPWHNSSPQHNRCSNKRARHHLKNLLMSGMLVEAGNCCIFWNGWHSFAIFPMSSLQIRPVISGVTCDMDTSTVPCITRKAVATASRMQQGIWQSG